jgi:hypothetical protein
MPARWGEDTTYKFVQLYQAHECLWNKHSTLYRDKEARENSIKLIVEDMALQQFGAEEVKQKIKSLRSTWGGEQHKIRKSELSSAGPDDVYKPPMKWFSLMEDIMRRGQVKRKTYINLVSPFISYCIQF